MKSSRITTKWINCHLAPAWIASANINIQNKRTLVDYTHSHIHTHREKGRSGGMMRELQYPSDNVSDRLAADVDRHAWRWRQFPFWRHSLNKRESKRGRKWKLRNQKSGIHRKQSKQWMSPGHRRISNNIWTKFRLRVLPNMNKLGAGTAELERERERGETERAAGHCTTSTRRSVKFKIWFACCCIQMWALALAMTHI